MRARAIASILGLVWLAACASASPVSSPVSGPTGAGESIPPDACPRIDLRSPSGETVDLTGFWRSPDGGTYFLRQYASCIWMTGFSADTTDLPDRMGASDWTNAFFGYLASDFTFEGSWADLPWGNDDGVGTSAWQIEFAEVGGVEAITLRVTAVSGGFGGLFLVTPQEEADLRVRLRDLEDCATVVSEDGEVYELVLSAIDWVVADPYQLYGPNGEIILPSDSFEIGGDLARGTGDCGPGLLFFADRIEALAQ